MALLDMGAEYHFYGSDITCSFPVNGKFTHDQSLLYAAVLDAHDAVISAMRPGVSWVVAIDALLLPALESPTVSEFFNRVEINRFRAFGGVRIESDVCVTSSGCVNMSKCPRKIEEMRQ
ncbi:hypothetical protein HAX54_021493 [Datura stramonium]|uniref:Peptidase M24 domain-containing protein n=1 Tax=Datura stramonium TaxID=4076 RepID=A0ABS8UUV8_DATST|nr:hypothetical protein [Datura stramonium]